MLLPRLGVELDGCQGNIFTDQLQAVVCKGMTSDTMQCVSVIM